MRRIHLEILEILKGLLDIKAECQKDSGDPSVPFSRGESWAGPDKLGNHNCKCKSIKVMGKDELS